MTAPAFHSPWLAARRLTAFLAWTVVFMPPYAVLMGFGLVRFCRRLARGYWRCTAAILGLQVVTRGETSKARPTLFVSNHISYFDIVVLGSVLDAAFIAKLDVRSWPAFGLIARLGRTVFVDRRPHKSRAQRDEIAARLAGGWESLILFPEGTSSDGNAVLPFKSALFSVAETVLGDGTVLTVQPVSIAYTRLDGMPMCRNWRPYFAWYGAMELVPHLWFAAGLGKATVEVEFHPPVKIDMFGTRKSLAEHCRAAVSNGLSAANLGRTAG